MERKVFDPGWKQGGNGLVIPNLLTVFRTPVMGLGEYSG